MTKRPWLFQLMTLVCFSLALSFPVQIMINYNFEAHRFFEAFHFLTPMNFMVMINLSIQALLSWNGSRSLIIVAPLSLIIVAFNNYQVGQWGYDYTSSEAMTASLMFSGLSLYLFLPPYFRAIRNPKIRWWLVPKRKAIEVPVRVSPSMGHRFHSFTVDMSETGAFIESQDDALSIGDEIALSFSANSIKPLQIKAEVVRKGSNQRQKRQDFGYGVRFGSLNQGQRKMLDKFLNNH